jgi:hypothetical protein
MVCTIPDCDGGTVARGWCKSHYYAWKRNGDPTIRKRLPKGATIADALFVYVDRTGGSDACWPWIASRAKSSSGKWGDYGISRVGGEFHYAHRMAWELVFGPIPAGLFVCHRCDNPPCCNPSHLFLGTPQDNVSDMVTKGRKAPSPTGAVSPRTLLTNSQVLRMSVLRDEGWTLKRLAIHFNVSRTTCHNALKNRRI